MKNLKEVLDATIEHKEIGGQHSVMINDIKTGKHIRYPVTTKSDAEYVSAFLQTVIATTVAKAFELTVQAAASPKQSDEATEVPPSVTGPADLNNPPSDDESSAVAESEEDESDDDSDEGGSEQTG